MKEIKLSIIILLTAVTTFSCSTVPLTGRKQLSLVNEGEMLSLANSSYSQFLSENNVIPSNNSETKRVKAVADKIIKGVVDFMNQSGRSSQIANYKWEVNLVDSKEINAWCMPGGKIVVYTGIIPICEDDAGLATVMGHEIAHAIARHSAERTSQQMAAQGLGVVGGVITASDKTTAGVFNQLYGVGAPLLLLKYSRNQESEADRLGLTFMAMAGYDPHQALEFWKRMASHSGGQKPPEFLSTHPADETRIADLEKEMPEAMKSYKPKR